MGGEFDVSGEVVIVGVDDIGLLDFVCKSYGLIWC